MKQSLTLILLLWLLTVAPGNAGWFSKDDQQQRLVLEQQLQQQRQITGQWQLASGILGVTCVVLLVVGAAIGAKTRKAVADER